MDLKDDREPVNMSPKERAIATVLIIEPDPLERNSMRGALRNLGFGGVSDVANHMLAFEKLEQRKFSHIIFDAKDSNMPALEFLKKALEAGPQTICIPSSYEPQVDDVFSMLCIGAKGYLCKPFTADTLDNAIVNATKGEPISEAIIGAKDRNEALVAILMQSLDKAALVLRQSQQFETALREVPRSLNILRRSADLAHTFARNGSDGFLESLEKFCIERSKGPATRLGRLRKRLKTKRGDEDDEPTT